MLIFSINAGGINNIYGTYNIMDYRQRFIKSLREPRPNTAKSVNPKKIRRDLDVSMSAKMDRTMLGTVLEKDHLMEARHTFSRGFTISQNRLNQYQRHMDVRLAKPKHVRLKSRK